jgi:ATP-binding cassette subfamily C protein
MSPVRYGLSHLKRRPLISLLLWSVPELLPSAVIGLAVANALDRGFLAGQPVTGLAWLGVIMAASLAGAAGGRQVLRRLGDLVEPLRDALVRRVVSGALQRGVAGRPGDGAVARLTRQTEIVRDTYAGLIVAGRGFLVTLTGTLAGLGSLSPALLPLILPPVAAGFGIFLFTLRLSAHRVRASVLAEEQVAVVVGSVLAGARDIAACGTAEHALVMAGQEVRQQAEAERAQAAVAALRTACFAVAAWVPLMLILVSGPRLTAQGLTAGDLVGALTYVLFGLQPALGKLMSGLGGSGLRFLVTLGRILEATEPVAVPTPITGTGAAIRLREVTFAYGPHSQPVLDNLDLDLAPGDHLAVIGPSGIVKSTLASILCGLVLPGDGTVHVSGSCVLIPQEAYVFTGSVHENLCYLRPDATVEDVRTALKAVGAQALVDGLDLSMRPAALSPGEKQLIALVRAYLSDAPVVILDEATCYLDPAAERQAEEAFMHQGRTLIVIAHRVSSALRAPKVLVLDGSGTAYGSHGTLSATSRLYRELLEPAGVSRDPDRFDARPATGLRQHTG